MRIARQRVTLLAPVIGLAFAASAGGQSMPHMGAGTSKAMMAPAPIRTTMEALHATGGIPKGWKFLMPPGDPARGREAFVALECFACHAVKGEDFPKTAKRASEPGPDLTGMGAHHPPEYFAESIINPNRVIIQAAGYTGQDGLSKMPDYSDSLTVHQLIDLVAYLTSLKTGMMHEHSGDKSMGGKPMDMKGHDMK
jgi:mono/diheme cytochrome c family protein